LSSPAPGPARWLGGWRGPFGALAVAALGIVLQTRWHADDLKRFDRYVQPGFDARVYLAMADAPGIFTVAPWGSRWLVPALVHAFAQPAEALTFLFVAAGALTLSTLALFVWLRRLGHAPGGSLLACGLFVASPPVSTAIGSPFLAEPVLVLLFVLLLLAIEWPAGAGVIAGLAALGTAGKEIFLVFLVGALAAAASRRLARPPWLALLAAGLPALGVHLLLQRWSNSPASSADWPTMETLALALYRILAGWRDWLPTALLCGPLPLALVGLARTRALPSLRRYGVLLAMTLGLPFVASVYTDDRTELPFFADDIPRLLIYALPLLLHFALQAFEWSAALPASTAPARERAWIWVLAALLPVCLSTQLDDYRRTDLRGPRDGRLVLALCRESLAFARRLEQGKPIAYDLPQRRFEQDRSDPRHLERMRWFLRAGFGRQAPYGSGPAKVLGPTGAVLLPCLRPAALRTTLWVSVEAAATVRVRANGQAVLAAELEGGTERLQADLPQDLLYRGDNLLTIEAPPEAGLALVDLRVQPIEAAAR